MNSGKRKKSFFHLPEFIYPPPYSEMARFRDWKTYLQSGAAKFHFAGDCNARFDEENDRYATLRGGCSSEQRDEQQVKVPRVPRGSVSGDRRRPLCTRNRTACGRCARQGAEKLKGSVKRREYDSGIFAANPPSCPADAQTIPAACGLDASRTLLAVAEVNSH